MPATYTRRHCQVHNQGPLREQPDQDRHEREEENDDAEPAGDFEFPADVLGHFATVQPKEKDDQVGVCQPRVVAGLVGQAGHAKSEGSGDQPHCQQEPTLAKPS